MGVIGCCYCPFSSSNLSTDDRGHNPQSSFWVDAEIYIYKNKAKYSSLIWMNTAQKNSAIEELTGLFDSSKLL